MGRTWVPVAGAVVGLVFVLTQLTGSDIDKQAGQTLYTALALVIFSALGAVGIGLTRLQPRFGILGMVTATFSLLAFGAVAVSLWGQYGFGYFGFGGGGETSASAAAITVLLAFSTAAASGLILMTEDAAEDDVRYARAVSLGALALVIALAILVLVVNDIDIGPRVYAILATIYVIGAIVAVTLRLLPRDRVS